MDLNLILRVKKLGLGHQGSFHSEVQPVQAGGIRLNELVSIWEFEAKELQSHLILVTTISKGNFPGAKACELDHNWLGFQVYETDPIPNTRAMTLSFYPVTCVLNCSVMANSL